MTNFPEELDTFVNPTATTAEDAPGVEHDVQHANLNDAMAAVQAFLGVSGSTVTTSIAYQVAQLVALLLTPGGQVRIQVIGGQAQLQIWDSGFQKYVPIVCANGSLGTGTPLSS